MTDLDKAIVIIERAENLAMACDGPVGPTLAALTHCEVEELCRLLKKDVITERVLKSTWRKHLRKARR